MGRFATHRHYESLYDSPKNWVALGLTILVVLRPLFLMSRFATLFFYSRFATHMLGRITTPLRNNFFGSQKRVAIGASPCSDMLGRFKKSTLIVYSLPPNDVGNLIDHRHVLVKKDQCLDDRVRVIESTLLSIQRQSQRLMPSL